MVINWSIGDVELGLVLLGLGIGDLNLKSLILKTPIPNWQLHHHLVILTFSFVLSQKSNNVNLGTGKRVDFESGYNKQRQFINPG